jgi:hypothetical protein
VFRSVTVQADAMVRQIIAANDPSAVRSGSHRRLLSRLGTGARVLAAPAPASALSPVALID